MFFMGCKSQTEDEGKIPITTSSDEAKKSYLQGRDLSEKLLAYDSRQHFEMAISQDPNFALAFYDLALASNSPKEFFTNLDKAVSNADKVSEGERLVILGLQAGVNNNSLKQKEYYEKLVSQFPNDERARNLLGNYMNGQQDYDKAIEEYKKATEINPNFSPSFNSLGYAYKSVNKYDDAEKAFKKYIELVPEDPNPYDSYAELLLKMGRYDESIENYQKALSKDPNFVGSHIGIAANYIYKGNYDQARVECQKLFNTARNAGEKRAALLGMTYTYLDEGKMDLALKELDKRYGIAKEENDMANMSADEFNKALILYEYGKYDDAAILFKKSVETFDQSNAAQEVKDNVKLNNLYYEGCLAIKKKDFSTANMKAEELMKGADQLGNQNQVRFAHELMGIIALNQKKWDKCISELQQADQTDQYNLYRMAAAYQNKGDKEKAKEYFMMVANDNSLPSMNYTFVRNKAKKMLKEKS